MMIVYINKDFIVWFCCVLRRRFRFAVLGLRVGDCVDGLWWGLAAEDWVPLWFASGFRQVGSVVRSCLSFAFVFGGSCLMVSLPGF